MTTKDTIEDKKHVHKWARVNEAWQHCSVCDKWRTTKKDIEG